MIVIISGKQGSGKTTMSRAVLEACERWKIITHRLRFAQPLYEMHDKVWEVMNRYGIDRDSVKDGPLLQLLGTEWGRKTISKNIWVNLMQNQIEQIRNDNANKNWVGVIEDCRFKNEFDAFPHALHVRLKCIEAIRKKRCESWREHTKHASEIDLDSYDELAYFDLYLDTGFHDIETCAALIIKKLGEKYDKSHLFGFGNNTK